jgi:hypothetical protein
MRSCDKKLLGNMTSARCEARLYPGVPASASLRRRKLGPTEDSNRTLTETAFWEISSGVYRPLMGAR